MASQLGACSLRFQYLSRSTRERLGIQSDEPCLVKSPALVEVFVGDGSTEDQVLFRRKIRDVAKNRDNLYNHIEAYAKDVGVAIPPVAEVRAWIQLWVHRALNSAR